MHSMVSALSSQHGSTVFSSADDCEAGFSTRAPAVPATSLKDLADRANNCHSTMVAAASKTIEAALACGAHLTEAKGRLPHGEWTSWARANLNFSPDWAGRYLQLHRERDQIGELIRARPDEPVSIKGALEFLREQRRPPDSFTQSSNPSRDGFAEPKPVAPIGVTRPEPPRTPPVSPGQSRVNGVVQSDPSRVAKRRQSGSIPSGVLVDVHVPASPTRLQDVEREHEERKAAERSLDVEWLASLPLFAILPDEQRGGFAQQAILYRRLELARQAFAEAVGEELRGKAREAYAWRLAFLLGTPAPEDWVACVPVKEGGCGGKGGIGGVQCDQCRGLGYLLQPRRGGR
jgi:hypothetical protein